MTRLAVLLLLIIAPAFGHPSPPFWEKGDPSSLADRVVDSLSEEELIGQVFLAGYSSDVPTPEIMAWLKDRNIGGVKIFGWNADDLPTLAESISKMQKAAHETRNGIPLFVATDQEGGWVRHVKGSTSITPGNMALGASGIPYDSYTTGYHIGRELKVLGINMNFAPAVDVYVDPEAHVIGPRAFSSDPVQTGVLAAAYFRGMKKAGVICTAKHFPGHGSAKGDSHGTLPFIHASYDELWKRDLLPYRMLIAEGIPAILSAHISFPNVTKDRTPASLSPFFARDVIRKDLGFRGVLITDDLYMTGARTNGLAFPEICVQALAAGNDMILLSRTPGLNDEIWKAVRTRYRRDGAFRDHIREAVKRIVATKLEHLRDEIPPDFTVKSGEIAGIPSAESRTFFLEQACRSVTVVKDPEKILPFRPEKGERVLLAGQNRTFLALGKLRYPDAGEFFFDYSPFFSSKAEDRERFRKTAKNYDTIIFCMANPNSLEVLNSIRGFRGRVIVFSVLTPVYIEQAPWVSAAVAVYGWSTESYKAGFAALSGDYAPEGRFPLKTGTFGKD